MRRFASAILIIILLFNFVGYRFVADYMEQRLNENLESRLDNQQYSDSQLIELKMAVNMPYQTSWSGYERYDGEVEIDGISYKYVKRKLLNDTLYLMCIPNTQKMELQAAKNDFFEKSNGISQNQNAGKPGNSKSIILKLISEYDQSISLLKPAFLSVSQQAFGSHLVKRIISLAHTSPGQPPDLLFA